MYRDPFRVAAAFRRRKLFALWRSANVRREHTERHNERNLVREVDERG
jgi:hypothetical protein